MTNQSTSLNDQVEAIHLTLSCENEEYRDLFNIIPGPGFIMGRNNDLRPFEANLLAAQTIREKARVMNNDEVACAKLSSVTKALRVVLRRYKGAGQ